MVAWQSHPLSLLLQNLEEKDSKKRPCIRDAQQATLKNKLEQHVEDPQLQLYLWYALGRNMNGTEPVVMTSCFPEDCNLDTDTATPQDLEAELTSSAIFFQMSRDMRERVLRQFR